MADRADNTISLYTDSDTRETLQRLAQAEQRSLSNMLTVMIRDYARRHESEVAAPEQAAPANGKQKAQTNDETVTQTL
jgi:predicted transcriptional regulator